MKFGAIPFRWRLAQGSSSSRRTVGRMRMVCDNLVSTLMYSLLPYRCRTTKPDGEVQLISSTPAAISSSEASCSHAIASRALTTTFPIASHTGTLSQREATRYSVLSNSGALCLLTYSLKMKSEHENLVDPYGKVMTERFTKS